MHVTCWCSMPTNTHPKAKPCAYSSPTHFSALFLQPKCWGSVLKRGMWYHCVWIHWYAFVCLAFERYSRYYTWEWSYRKFVWVAVWSFGSCSDGLHEKAGYLTAFYGAAILLSVYNRYHLQLFGAESTVTSHRVQSQLVFAFCGFSNNDNLLTALLQQVNVVQHCRRC